MLWSEPGRLLASSTAALVSVSAASSVTDAIPDRTQRVEPVARHGRTEALDETQGLPDGAPEGLDGVLRTVPRARELADDHRHVLGVGRRDGRRLSRSGPDESDGLHRGGCHGEGPGRDVGLAAPRHTQTRRTGAPLLVLGQIPAPPCEYGTAVCVVASIQSVRC